MTAAHPLPLVDTVSSNDARKDTSYLTKNQKPCLLGSATFTVWKVPLPPTATLLRHVHTSSRCERPWTDQKLSVEERKTRQISETD